MSDTKTGDDKTLSVNTKKTLTLKRPGTEQGTVRQNFSHGRSKAVVVETKKRKFSMPGEKPEAAAAAPIFKPKPQPAAPQPQQQRPQQQRPQQQQRAPQPAPRGPANERAGMVLNQLSTDEIEARRRALEGAKARENEERQRAAEDARRRAEDEERRRREQLAERIDGWVQRMNQKWAEKRQPGGRDVPLPGLRRRRARARA